MEKVFNDKEDSMTSDCNTYSFTAEIKADSEADSLWNIITGVCSDYETAIDEDDEDEEDSDDQEFGDSGSDGISVSMYVDTKENVTFDAYNIEDVDDAIKILDRFYAYYKDIIKDE